MTSSNNKSPKNFKLQPEHSNENKKFLALDLDETLIHCRSEYFRGVTAVTRARICNQEVDLFVSKRPGLEEFMETMAKHYHLILYTSGLKDYAYAVLKLMKLERYFPVVYHRSYCQRNSEKKYEKDLSIIGVHPRDIILVDDSAVHVRNQPNNILLTKEFKGESDDRELSRITDFLIELAHKNDVRPVNDSFKTYEQRKASGKSPVAKPANTTVYTSNAQKFLKSEVKCSDELDSEFSAEDVSENYNGASLSMKVPMIIPQKKLFSHELKAKFTSVIVLEQREDDDDSTEDSFEELAIRSAGPDTSMVPAVKISLSKFGTEECLRTERLAENMPSMTPKSFLNQLKSLGSQ